MTDVLILSAVLVLLVLSLGLPLLLKPGSLIPDILGGIMLIAYVGIGIWATGAWWVLLPVFGLVAWVVWFDEANRDARLEPALDARGRSARTRLRFRLWRIANFSILALIASVFFLPAGSAGTIVLPGMTTALVAMSAFRFSFYRAWQRDGEERADAAPATASPAASG